MIHVISATRKNVEQFWNSSALGVSIRRFNSIYSNIQYHIQYENSTGLPKVYNSVLNKLSDKDYAVFVHDDIWIDDMFFFQRIDDALNTFDIVGVVGCKVREPFQINWAFSNKRKPNGRPEWMDKKHLSGTIAHGESPFGELSYYGESGVACKLLDGCFLVVNIGKLRSVGCLFDERFDFHYYDTDFCRSADYLGLSIGTWPISLTHQSQGEINYESWAKNYKLYREKWNN